MTSHSRQISCDKTKLLEGADSKDVRIFKDQTMDELSSQILSDGDLGPGFLGDLEQPRHQRSVSNSGGADGCCSKLRSLKQRLNLGDGDSYKVNQSSKFKSPGYQVLDGSVSLPRKHPLKSSQQIVMSPSDYCPVYVGSNPTSVPSSNGMLTLKQRGRHESSRIKTPSPSLHSPSNESQLFSDSHVTHNRKNEKMAASLRHAYITMNNNNNNLSDSTNSLGSSGFQSQSSMAQSCTEPSRPCSAVPTWRNVPSQDSNPRPMTSSVKALSSKTTSTSPVQPTKHGNKNSQAPTQQNFTLQNGDGLRYLAQSAHVTGKTSGEAEENNFRPGDHAQRMLHRMEMSLHKRQLCDVILTSGGRSIPAHRIVLAAASDYFAAMFTNEVLEAVQEEIFIKGVEPVALLTCIKYIYTGQLDIQEDTVEGVLSAACLLQLSEVAEACGRFLSKQLHPSNCIGIRQFADMQGCSQLYSNADAYVLDNFAEVVKNQEFYLLSVDEMSRLLGNDDISVTSEVIVFEALLSWAYHDDPARRKDLARLMALVRLPLLPAQYLADKVASCQLFRDDMACQELIMESLKYHLLPERRLNMLSLRTRPRKSTVGVLYAVGGMDCTKGSVSIEMYDMRANQWQQVANMNGRRLQFGVALLDSTLYVVGGRDGLKTLNTVECFDLKSKTWSNIPSMATHRHGLGVGVLEGPMYAVGGHDGWSYLSSVERWDPQAKQWSYVASLSTARSTAGVAVLGNKLYAVGGRDGSSCLRSVECYDPHTNRWNLCSPMNKRRGGVGVAVCNDFLYAVGGHDAPSSNPTSSRFDCVERYDFKTDTWTTVASISSPRDAVGVCVLGDRLYAVGGYDGMQYLSNVECYDTQSNEWSKVAPLCVGRAGACVMHLPVRL